LNVGEHDLFVLELLEIRWNGCFAFDDIGQLEGEIPLVLWSA
jgi:hypothetical protein